MRKSLLIAVAFLAIVASTNVSQAVLVGSWTFETSPPADLSNNVTIGPLAADAGAGTATGVHASANTDWTTPAGNGSDNSLSSNTWATGDYYQFTVVPTGNSDFTFTWDQTGSSTGPRDFSLQVSINGSAFASVLDYSVLLNGGSPNPSWASSGTGLPSAAYGFSHTISSVPLSATSLALRLTMRNTTSIGGATVAAGGTGRVDNFVVNAVPEASSFLFGGLACCVGAVTLVSRKLRARKVA